MKNNYSPLMSAKASQISGGGSSQCSTSRSIGAQRFTLRSIGAQYFTRFLGSSCRVWKYVACMLLAFFMGVGNVWGADPTPGEANSAYLDISKYSTITTASWSVSNLTNLYAYDSSKGILRVSVYGSVSASGTQKWVSGSIGNTSRTWDATGNFAGSAAYMTSSSKCAQLASSKNATYKVTNCTKVEALYKTGGSSRKIYLKVYEQNADGSDKSTPVEAGSDEWSGSNEIHSLQVSDLNPSKVYKVIATNDGTGNSDFYEMAFTTSASTGPSISSFSPATGASVGASQEITITGSTGSTVYYLWATSEPASAAVVSADHHGTAGEASATTTVESGKTLYAVAVKDATNSTVASATYTIDATAPTLSSSTPANSTANVGTSGDIKLTFSENVTVNDASKFSISPSAGVTLSTPTVSGAVVTIPYSGLSEGTEYTFSTAAGAVKDGANNTSAALSDITFTTCRCAVSSCGNASLTYAINASTDVTNTAANLLVAASTKASNTTALGISTTAALSTISISDSDNKGKAAAATNSCFAEKQTMSSKIGMYNGSSYSSSNYLQFTFTVKEGYTFTPCDIQFVVQPVSAGGSFRWEVTDGAEVYGYGTGDAGQGNPAGATVLTGLNSTAQMSAGTYYIRLYPYHNGGNTFRISNDVILKGTTAEAVAPSCTTLDAPTGLAENTEARTTDKITFIWTAAANASSYDVKLWNNSGCTGDPIASDNVTTTSKQFTGLTDGTTYYCKVQSKGDGETYCTNGGTTDAVSGTTDALPSYTVTAVTSTGNNDRGTVSATASSIKAGATTTITAVPEAGYRVANWAVSGIGATISPSGASNSLTTTLTMGTADATVTVTFEEIPCPTSGVVYSADVASGVSSNQSVSKNTTVEWTSSQATVSGGKAYAINNESDDKDLISSSKSKYRFAITNSGTIHKFELDCAIQEGDVIKIDMVGGHDDKKGDIGIWVSTSETRPSSAPACAGSWAADEVKTDLINYTVTSTDEYHGKKVLYVHRSIGKSTYFSNVRITRPEKFDVTYYKNDGTDASTLAEGVAVVADNEFSRSGYRFIEWNTQADGEGSKVNVGAAVTEDIVLYAIWAAEYSVSYANTDAASGDAPTNANKYIAGESFKVAGVGTMVAADNYTFSGWSDGAATYVEGDTYTVGTVNVAFTPVWTLSYSVYYYPNGGTGTAYTAANPATVNECFFAPEAGKLFDKWTTHEDGTGDVYAPGASVTTTMNLYAQWKDDECTARQSLIEVIFTGEKAATAVTNGYNEKEYAGSALINKVGDNSGPNNGGYKIYGDGGYVFATIAKGNFQEGDKLEIEITSVPGSQKLDIYAYGDDIASAYKVVSIEQVSVAGTYSYALTAANAAAINTLGYKCLGVYRAATSNMNPYIKSLKISGCRAWTVYHDVTFDLNGQSGSVAPQSIAEGGLVTKPADPSADGYYFRGWYTDDECSDNKEWNFEEDAVGNTDLILYAKWEEDPCTDRQSIAKVVLTSASAGTVTGYNNDEYAGTAIINGLGGNNGSQAYDFGDGSVTGYKLAVSKSTLMATLSKGEFQEGDMITIAITKKADDNKLEIYAASDVDHAVLVKELDANAEGVYAYTLTAADATTINTLGYKSIGVYRGSYNPFVYSVEITGCRTWSVYHSLTFKNIDGTEEVATESLAEGEYASTVAPSAPKVSGYRFIGWAETIGGTPVDMNSYTITEDKILYAVYGDCPTSGTIFSLNMNKTVSEDVDVRNGSKDLADYATISGGTAILANTSNNTRAKVTETPSIQFSNGNEGYMQIDLDCPVLEGDIIRYVNTSSGTIGVRTAHGTSTNETTLDGNKSDITTVEVSAALDGLYRIFVERKSNTSDLKYFEIYRRPVLTGITMDDMRLKVGQSGTPTLHLLPSDDAQVTNQAWEIIASTAPGTTINESTGLITAGAATGDVTIQVTLNGDKMATCTVTIVEGYESVKPVTGTTTWDWEPVSTQSNGPTITAPDTVLANYISGTEWEMLAGNHSARPYRGSSYKAYQGARLYFKAAVPGMLTVNAGYTSDDKSGKIYVNGHEIGTTPGNPADLNKIAVPAGDVFITAEKESMRIYKMTFDADLASHDITDNMLNGYTREVNPQYYGTICLPKAGVIVGATLFELAYMDYKEDGVTPYKVYYDEIINGTMETGMPYIFLAHESTIGVFYTDDAEKTAKDKNGLHGTLVDKNDMSGDGIYMLYNNQVLHSTNSGSYLNANRAYIQISEIPGYDNPNHNPAPPKLGRRRISTNFNSPQIATGLEDAAANEKPVKVMINGEMYVIRAGHVYTATGMLVK